MASLAEVKPNANSNQVAVVSHSGRNLNAALIYGRRFGLDVQIHSFTQLSAADWTSDSPGAPRSISLAKEDRSRKMEESIRRRQMGPYTTCRLAMFEAIAEVMAGHQANGIALKELLASALRIAEAKLDNDPDRTAKAREQPWRKVEAYMANLLARSGTLLDEAGKSIGFGFRFGLAMVHSLSPNWEVKADAEILLALLGDWHDVSQRDIPNLAGVLYHDRGGVSSQGRALAVVQYLVQQRRVVESHCDGVKFIRLADAATVATPSSDRN